MHVSNHVSNDSFYRACTDKRHCVPKHCTGMLYSTAILVEKKIFFTG